MKPKRQVVGEGAIGSWIPVSTDMRSPLGFTVRPHASATGSYDVQFTESDLNNIIKCTYSRTTTTLTITFPSEHGLTTADSLHVLHGDWEGDQAIASVSSVTAVTVTVADSGGSSGDIYLVPMIVDTVTDFSAATGLNSGNVSASVTAMRLDASSISSDDVTFLINQRY